MDVKSVVSDIEELLVNTGSAQGVVWQGGELLLDWAGKPDPVDVFAVQKGLLTILIGIAEEQYLLETIDHINHHLDPEWTKLSPWDEAKLSIETLLSMTTGMADDLSLQGEINQTWRYNNVAYNYLKQILTLQSDMSLQELSQQWLFEPLGMSSSHWVERDQKLPSGHGITALFSTAGEIAEVGKLILNHGKVDERQLLPAHFIEQMLSQRVAENPAWTWGWWNNRSEFHVKAMREDSGPVDGPILPKAPDDLIAARGAFGNYLHIVPSMELVLVRTCTPDAEKPRAFERAVWDIIANS